MMQRILVFCSWALLGALLIMDVLTTTILIGLGGIEGSPNPVIQFVVYYPMLHLALKIAFGAVVLIAYEQMENHFKGDPHLGNGIGIIPVLMCSVLFALAFINNMHWIEWAGIHI